MHMHPHKETKNKRVKISQIRDRILYDAFIHPWPNGKKKKEEKKTILH